MAKFILKNAFFSFNAVDLSDHVRAIDTPLNTNTQDQTVMSDNTEHMLAGLKSGDWSLTFAQDFAASKVDATFFADWSAGTERAVIVRADAGAVSATNPRFMASMIVSDYTPIGGSVGDLAEAPITLAITSGDVETYTA